MFCFYHLTGSHRDLGQLNAICQSLATLMTRYGADLSDHNAVQCAKIEQQFVGDADDRDPPSQIFVVEAFNTTTSRYESFYTATNKGLIDMITYVRNCDDLEDENLTITTTQVYLDPVEFKEDQPTSLGELLRRKLAPTIEPVVAKKDWQKEFLDWMNENNKVGAIKTLRVARGIGLKEGLDIVKYWCGENTPLWNDLTPGQKDIVKALRSYTH